MSVDVDPTTDETDPSEFPVTKGLYTWADFMRERGYGDDVDAVYEAAWEHRKSGRIGRLFEPSTDDPVVPHGSDWERTEFDPADYLGFDPDELSARIGQAAALRKAERARYEELTGEPLPASNRYTWEHFKRECYYDRFGNPPRADDGSVVPFDPVGYLGFDPDELPARLEQSRDAATVVESLAARRTVNVDPEVDEDDFFSTPTGHTTIVNRYDLEKTVPTEKKPYLVEVERYWVNKPYAFAIVFHSNRENEKKYYVVEPHLNELEAQVKEFLTGKLRTAIKYSDDEVAIGGSHTEREETIERLTRRLLGRYSLYQSGTGVGLSMHRLKRALGLAADEREGDDDALQGVSARPEPAVLAEDDDTLNDYQVAKLLYYLKRDFIGYGRIDAIKHDINVEDISCDGYDSPVFVYHSGYEQIISNVTHGTTELDNFVVKLAQRSGKSISKRQPQVDATLPDGSRAQLTLGTEVSGHGTNYTIRQFKEVPFTPVDLVNWHTFSLDEMAYLWLAIENKRSLIFSGGTASGKTTSLNAVSLFIPSNSKIVSIEDTREVELPQRNWIASVTRPSFTHDGQGDVDEFDLLEAALRQRPDYIVMGEVRGEEGRTLFQVMSTGHTTLTTFHADSVGEVLKRFTTEPINVSKSMFTALDLVSVQTSTRVRGQKVRRNKAITEINHYDAENDEINVRDVFQWNAQDDEYLNTGESTVFERLMFDLGWTSEKLATELFERKVVLAYLIVNGLKEYGQVAATIQSFISDPETVLSLMANDRLERSLDDLRKMESVLINVDPEKEALVPRPDPSEAGYAYAMSVLEEAAESLFCDYRDVGDADLSSAFVHGIEPTVITVPMPSLSALPSGEELGALTDGGNAVPALESATEPNDDQCEPAVSDDTETGR